MSRFDGELCNCCVDYQAEIFCMVYFYIYLIFFLMFSAFTLYYLVQKSRGCAGSRPVNKETEDT